LLERGADPNLRDSFGQPIWHSLCCKYCTPSDKIFALLLKHGLAVNATDARGDSILHNLINSPHPSVASIRSVLRLGVDPSLRAAVSQDTPIIAAARRLPVTLDVLELLIEVVGLEQKSTTGNTILFYAVAKQLSKLIKNLIERGIDVNVKNNRHNTALHFACESGNHEIMSLLLCTGANCNQRNILGQTPLHKLFLAEHLSVDQRFDCAILLIEAGADITLLDKEERIAFSYQGNSALNNALIRISAWQQRRDALALWQAAHPPRARQAVVASLPAVETKAGHSCVIQ